MDQCKKTFPRALEFWALDSGGFTELTKWGRWRTSAPEFVADVRRYRDEVGKLSWSSIMDWMCEPEQLARTGKTLREHQQRTVDSLLELEALAPEIQWAPALQGWTVGDYLECIELYDRAGVNLLDYETVGVGSVCRRQHTEEAAEIIETLAGVLGPNRLHGYGFKRTGIRRVGRLLRSSDSMAWSKIAREHWREHGGPIVPTCHHGKSGTGSCANCAVWALKWREMVLGDMHEGYARKPSQLTLF